MEDDSINYPIGHVAEGVRQLPLNCLTSTNEAGIAVPAGWGNAQACRSSVHKPFAEVEMATQTRSRADRLTHPLLEKLGDIPAGAEIFLYSVKIVCGKQTEANCCCVAGTRPGVYATEVNIQNLSLEHAPVQKAFLPLIKLGAVVAREPKVADPAAPGLAVEDIILPPLGATMDDCCRIAELLLGGPPSGDTALIIGILPSQRLGPR
jgi:hypothetical protein